MKPHFINQLNTFISGWYHSNIDFCDEIINYFHSSADKKPGMVGTFDGRIVIDSDYKDSTDLTVRDQDFENKIKTWLQVAVEKYIEQYPYCNEYAPWSIIENINIQHYKPTQGYHGWHTERFSQNEPFGSRHLVFMAYCNTVDDGGETEFFHQKIKIKPEKGLVLFWPADWTFTHRGISSPSQDKYILTGWYNFLYNNKS
jgi:hypothetical protein